MNRLRRPNGWFNLKTQVTFDGRFVFQHVMKHMNLQPLDSHGVDFSRVRMWNLNNWARHYRQTLVFSSIQDPQINSILTKHCANYRGQISTKNMPKTGSICQVLVQLPHVFQMFSADSFMDHDAR